MKQKIKFLICFLSVTSLYTVCQAQNWSKNVYIGGDGVAEAGKYFDFHETYNGTEDFSVRLSSLAGKLVSTGSFVSTGVGVNTGSFSNGQVSIFGNSANSTNLILAANMESTYRWRFKTIDRGNGIDLDITTSNWLDQEETLFKISPTLSGRPELSFLSDWFVINNGNVGIGTATPNTKLAVNGNIRAKEIKVETANWPDFVFAKDYVLPTLQETEKHIKKNGHLPGIPSATEVEKNGIELGDMNKRLLQKIEELTLYLIEQKKEIQTLNSKVEGLQKNQKRY